MLPKALPPFRVWNAEYIYERADEWLKMTGRYRDRSHDPRPPAELVKELARLTNKYGALFVSVNEHGEIAGYVAAMLGLKELEIRQWHTDGTVADVRTLTADLLKALIEMAKELELPFVVTRTRQFADAHRIGQKRNEILHKLGFRPDYAVYRLRVND